MAYKEKRIEKQKQMIGHKILSLNSCGIKSPKFFSRIDKCYQLAREISFFYVFRKRKSSLYLAHKAILEQYKLS